jgi:hypothetical protein
MPNLDLEVLRDGLDSINAHVVSLGGEIKTGTDFDPTKSSKASTADMPILPSLDKAEEDKYDPTKVSEMIEFIKKQRHSQLERKIENRDIKVLNMNNSAENLK